MKSIKIPQETDNPVLNITLDTLKKNKQALIFVNTKRSAERTAEDISLKIKTKDGRLFELSEKILNSLASPTTQCRRLANCIKKGIAFHHAGLVAKQRELIEDNFRKGIIKIISCTPTLAFGLDLPAFRSVLRDLKRYTSRGMRHIPVLEYMQMAGRAGRPKYDKYGEAICLAGTEGEKEKIEELFLSGIPEDIESKLAVEPVLRTYLLSLIASDFVNSKQKIMDFFEKTFWAYQYKDMDALERKIDKVLLMLEDWEFIRTAKGSSDFVSADEFAGGRIKATLLGKRIAELYIDPYTAYFLIECLKRTNKTIKHFSFLQIISHTLEIRPLLKVRVKEYDKIQEMLVEQEQFLLEPEPEMFDQDYDDFLNSIKTALFIQDWIDEKSEENLLEEYNIRPGEIRSKLDIADWLLYCIDEIAKLMKYHKIIKEVTKLRIRIKYGVKEELLPLVKLKNIGRVRARKLSYNGIKDLKDVRKADVMKLIQILGKNTALDIKKQVGEDYSKIKVKENKRKGQISLEDY